MAGERLCWEGEEWWRGVTVMAKEVVGGADAIGRIGWGGSTAAGVAGVDVAGSGAMGGGGEDFCGAGVAAVSSAREPRKEVMTVVASMGGAGGARDVSTARVATSDIGVAVGGSVVVETTMVVSVVAAGGVEVGAVAGAVEAAAASVSIRASTMD